jgi:predicted DNA-binding transcriptional regulator YafY
LFTAAPKNTLILAILEILRKNTDSRHRFLQKDIMANLQSEYGLTAARKAVRQNLTNLQDLGYPVEYQNGWYYDHEFTESELRLLIDSLLFSKHVPYDQCMQLAGKLESLAGKHFKSGMKNIRGLSGSAPENKELFLTIEVLDEAIANRKQVLFLYNDLDTDGKLHPRLDDRGMTREYTVNPYQIVAANGWYYLIGNCDKYDNAVNFRLDRITGIRLLGTDVKNMRLIKGLENGLNLPKHMAEHIYMFSGKSIDVRFRAKRYLISEIMDWFGAEVTFSHVTDKETDVKVHVNEMAMRCWALQYGLHITVLEPKELMDAVAKDAREVAGKYAVHEIIMKEGIL